MSTTSGLKEVTFFKDYTRSTTFLRPGFLSFVKRLGFGMDCVFAGGGFARGRFAWIGGRVVRVVEVFLSSANMAAFSGVPLRKCFGM
jgi:hypothetical protein